MAVRPVIIPVIGLTVKDLDAICSFGLRITEDRKVECRIVREDPPDDASFGIVGFFLESEIADHLSRDGDYHLIFTFERGVEFVRTKLFEFIERHSGLADSASLFDREQGIARMRVTMTDGAVTFYCPTVGA